MPWATGKGREVDTVFYDMSVLAHQRLGTRALAALEGLDEAVMLVMGVAAADRTYCPAVCRSKASACGPAKGTRLLRSMRVAEDGAAASLRISVWKRWFMSA